MHKPFEITEIAENKIHYLPLLLIGDESEKMILKYLDKGRLFVGKMEKRTVAVCVVIIVNQNTVEIKNLAVEPDYQKHGLGHRMLSFIESEYIGKTIILGTGETPSTLQFYKSAGYSYSHKIPNFFTDNYPEPIIEEGITLKDMIYLKKQSPLLANNLPRFSVDLID